MLLCALFKVIGTKCVQQTVGVGAQEREQMSGLDLHAFTLKFLALKKRASKVAHNRPRPFYFTVQPRPQSTAHCQELIFHIMESRDQTSLLLSVSRSFKKFYW